MVEVTFVTVVVVIIGLHAHVHEGLTAVNGVAFGLAIVWGVTGRGLGSECG